VGNYLGGVNVIPESHVINPKVGVYLDNSKVRDVVMMDDFPRCLYDRDESGEGLVPSSFRIPWDY